MTTKPPPMTTHQVSLAHINILLKTNAWVLAFGQKMWFWIMRFPICYKNWWKNQLQLARKFTNTQNNKVTWKENKLTSTLFSGERTFFMSMEDNGKGCLHLDHLYYSYESPTWGLEQCPW
jgi:hypothetical protein